MTAPRLMHYALDNYGVGHLARTITIAAAMRAAVPDLEQLIVTPSPVVGDFDWVFVFGPLMAQRDRDELTGDAVRAGVRCLGFVPDMPNYIGAGDVVITMGGYTLFDSVAHARPCLVVPRGSSDTEQQLIELEALLAQPPGRATLEFDGLARTVDALRSLLVAAVS